MQSWEFCKNLSFWPQLLNHKAKWPIKGSKDVDVRLVSFTEARNCPLGLGPSGVWQKCLNLPLLWRQPQKIQIKNCTCFLIETMRLSTSLKKVWTALRSEKHFYKSKVQNTPKIVVSEQNKCRQMKDSRHVIILVVVRHLILAVTGQKRVGSQSLCAQFWSGLPMIHGYQSLLPRSAC